MRNLRTASRFTLLVAGVLMGAGAPDASAQSILSGCANERVQSFKGLFASAARDVTNLPSMQTAGILALGGAGAIAAHPTDHTFSDSFSSNQSMKEPFGPGAIVGGFPAQMGAAFLTYGLGRAFKNDCIAAVGGELVQAQLISQFLTYSIKGAVRRARPEGGGFSFPSGHTTAAFASATVLQRHFGWKIGVPAYAAATYVAASRVQGQRHYLSDVAFGAALGIVAGRTVTIPGGHKLSVGPVATEFGPAAGMTWKGR
jgi:hypothetical protein